MQTSRPAEAQLKKYLPLLLTGEQIGSLAMSEPNAGSDVVSMRTRVEKKDGRWVMNGSKCWCVGLLHFIACPRIRASALELIRSTELQGELSERLLTQRRITNAPLSSTFIIYARSTKEGQASKGITAFLVERGWKGFEVGEHLDKFGVSSPPSFISSLTGKLGHSIHRADEIR
jgi:isovaleryl-CoA dehydrogenase